MSRLKRLAPLALVLTLVFGPGAAWADWLKMSPPPDVDKSNRHGATWRNFDTCWLATAANMLAGAGYGTTLSTTPQGRANAIYNQLFGHFGNRSGWIDDALTWWLNHRNDDPANDYDTVTLRGNRARTPWNSRNAARDIANRLRGCELVGMSISWARGDGSTYGGHAITPWGDSGANTTSPLTGNPSRIRLADSDSDSGGDVQRYTQTWRNGNAGNGWYLNYRSSGNDAFVKHITTLTGGGNRRAVGSLQVRQGRWNPARGLRYTAYTDVPIRSYKTSLNRTGSKTVTEDLNRPGGGQIRATWSFSVLNWVPRDTRVRITTEFTEDDWNAVGYRDVRYTYSDPDLKAAPDHGWRVESLEDPDGQYYGGYVVGAYDLEWDNPDPLGQGDEGGIDLLPGRLIHQFGPTDNREFHLFNLTNAEEGPEALPFLLRELRFGYSDGFLDEDELWDFEDWLVQEQTDQLLLPGATYQYPINFPTLPYYLEQPNPGLDPIPEPATGLLFGIGIGALAVRLRSRRRRGEAAWGARRQAANQS